MKCYFITTCDSGLFLPKPSESLDMCYERNPLSAALFAETKNWKVKHTKHAKNVQLCFMIGTQFPYYVNLQVVSLLRDYDFMHDSFAEEN